MKNICLFLLLLGGAPLYGTQDFWDSSIGAAQDSIPARRVYFSPWINRMAAAINANSALGASTRADALEVLDLLAQAAAPLGARGTFQRQVGGVQGSIEVSREVDFETPAGYMRGSGFAIAASIHAPDKPPAMFRLDVSAGQGGSAVGGGLFAAGTHAPVTAIPDPEHDFVGWNGDAAGSASVISVLMDRDRSVQATFGVKSFTLSTSATVGGTVTPGGTYQFGATVTVAAMPEATHYFSGWSGDASGGGPVTSLLIDRAKAVQAVFAPKASQTISFGALADQGVGQELTLTATASSGLPVEFEIVQGTVNMGNGRLTVMGPGLVSVRAVQAGDAYHLPATPVVRTFNAAGAARVRVQSAARTLLATGRTAGSLNYLLGAP